MNYYVVHVYQSFAFVDKLHELVVDHGLERGGGVHEAKEHNRRFEQSIACLECHFPFVAFLDPDVVVAPADVELCKPFLSRNSVDEFGDKGKGVAVGDRPRI